MVMHARKFPKLDDGYDDQVSSHVMEESDKRPDNRNSKRLGSDYCYSDSPVSKSLSPARFAVKHSGRSDRRSEDAHHNSHASCREIRNKDQKQKDHKAEVHRLAENICGDWSEHVSSSGKRYYYNCKTEVSQWEKPKDWNDSLFTFYGSRSAAQTSSKQLSKDKLSDSRQTVRRSVDRDAALNRSSSDDSQCGSCVNLVDNIDERTSDNNLQTIDSTHHVLSPGGSSPSWRHRHDNRAYSDYTGAVGCGSGNAGPTVYGLVKSTEDVSLPNRRSCGPTTSGCHQIADGEDMDISPGSTPTEESLLEKRLSSSSVINNSASATSPAVHLCDPRTPAAQRQTTHANSTFLNTLAALQQALQQVTVDKSTASGTSKSVPSSVLNLLAALPSLICQLRSAERPSSAQSSTSSSQNQHSDQQQLTQNVIQMLQKLQQVLVAQQQQQQQRQLQELLLQLLTVQKHGTGEPYSSPTSSPKQFQSDVLMDEHKLESPYSPPDSDGTPLSSPDNKTTIEPVHIGDGIKSSDTPQCDDVLRSTTQSPSRLSSPVVNNSSFAGSNPLVATASMQSSMLAAATVNRKQYDSAGLTPTLTNYVNSSLIDHVTGWHTDIADKQASCYNEESQSLSSLHCTQVSVDLKRARSLVRVNEIQSTLHEQRVMLIRQQTKDLENMRTGLSFYTAVPSGT